MPAHTDTMMVQGLHRRFEGQQEKQVVIDSKLWPVKTFTFTFTESLVLVQNELKGSGDVFPHAC